MPSAIEVGGCCDLKGTEIKVVFRWMTETTVADCVHIILSDVDSQIELKNVSSERYESDLISIIPGKYYGQIVIRDEIKPLKVINVSPSTTYAEIEVENDGVSGHVVVANYTQNLNEEHELIVDTSKDRADKFGPSQVQMNGAATGDTDMGSKGVQVNYELNKRLALTKKMVSCEREDIVVLACRIEDNVFR